MTLAPGTYMTNYTVSLSFTGETTVTSIIMGTSTTQNVYPNAGDMVLTYSTSAGGNLSYTGTHCWTNSKARHFTGASNLIYLNVGISYTGSTQPTLATASSNVFEAIRIA